MVAKIDVTEAFAPVRKLKKIVLCIAAFIIVKALAGAFLLTLYITRPVKKLSDTVLKISKGDLKQRVDTKSKDEIGLLADSFNIMTSKLQFSREELIKHDKELEMLNNKLININKELEAFCFSVSHDLRTPLRSINGFSDALLEDYNDKLDLQGKDYLHRVCAASQHMGQLIDDLLTLSRITRGDINRETINLSGLAHDITEELRENEPERNVEFVIAKEVITNGDKHLLQIALQNLFDNAWKFTSKHTKARIEFGITLINGKYQYFVNDDGAGFDITYANKLFVPFQRLHTTTEFKGTGIGLATVQRIIHKHGGNVWAEGEVEKGATIYFTL